MNDGATAIRYTYGSAPDQFGDFLPSQVADARGTVVFIHGGLWRAGRGWEVPARAVERLVSNGWHVWRVQYRGVGGGGGWPGTADDVASSIDVLSRIQTETGVALGPIVLVGHSAGGHLAVLALGYRGATDGETTPEIAGAVSLEGVLDLLRAEDEDLGEGAVAAFLGGTSSELAEQYRLADPIRSIQPRFPVRLVHARGDSAVPMSQSENYLAAALAAGQDVSLAVVEGDHFTVVDPDSEAWPEVERAIEEIAAPQR